MTLEEARANVGRTVVYWPIREWVVESGVITSVGDHPDSYVFVRFGSDIHSKATRPEDLQLEHP